ncbi:hypothetical protein NQ314_010862 [Rhamnusium bicolor]|uniref:Uncharacterized protein n=1 Tax=Rhamnusium bicolor TaxID=1586634 RepID=A0AAV8XN45_9CUCU|nr:hypothetical protein NQ314_010862 [Rhamnusium bicolor]
MLVQHTCFQMNRIWLTQLRVLLILYWTLSQRHWT